MQKSNAIVKTDSEENWNKAVNYIPDSFTIIVYEYENEDETEDIDSEVWESDEGISPEDNAEVWEDEKDYSDETNDSISKAISDKFQGGRQPGLRRIYGRLYRSP